MIIFGLLVKVLHAACGVPLLCSASAGSCPFVKRQGSDPCLCSLCFKVACRHTALVDTVCETRSDGLQSGTEKELTRRQAFTAARRAWDDQQFRLLSNKEAPNFSER